MTEEGLPFSENRLKPEPVWLIGGWSNCSSSTCSSGVGFQLRNISCSVAGACKAQKPDESKSCFSGIFHFHSYGRVFLR